MNKILSNFLATPFLWFASCCIATAQAPVAQADQIIDDGSQQIIQDDNSGTGKFEPVIVDPSSNSDVTLQFPINMASKPVVIQGLDGGTVTSDGGPSIIGPDGSLSLSFQVTNQPGVHRVIVIDPNADEDSPYIIGIVQFEVPAATE